jgi:hypothetical protein
VRQAAPYKSLLSSIPKRHIIMTNLASSGSKASTIAGWILTILLSAVLLGPSAGSKFAEWEGKEAEFAKSGFTTAQMFNIGIVEVACALLYLFPPTAFLGAILLTGYMGGAIVTHVRVGELFVPQVVIAILIWVALALRRPHLFKMLWQPFGQSKAN